MWLKAHLQRVVQSGVSLNVSLHVGLNTNRNVIGDTNKDGRSNGITRGLSLLARGQYLRKLQGHEPWQQTAPPRYPTGERSSVGNKEERMGDFVKIRKRSKTLMTIKRRILKLIVKGVVADPQYTEPK